MKKYNIENFYIGELFLSHSIDNLQIPESMSDIEKDEMKKIIFFSTNGVIDYQKKFLTSYTDQKSRRHYYGFLTIFYKNSDTSFICLHDRERYNINDKNNLLKNLIPLDNFFPKVSYCSPKSLSFKDSLLLFDSLFKKNSTFLYDRSSYDISRFYIGNLNLCTRKESSHENQYVYQNLPFSFLTYTNNAQFIGGFRLEHDFSKYDYEIFKCLFLKIKNDEIYNINNFQIYNHGLLENRQNNNYSFGENFYDYVVPFTQELDEQKIKYTRNFLSISKALKLQKKLFDYHK